jgi:outer membrane protein TolC
MRHAGIAILTGTILLLLTGCQSPPTDPGWDREFPKSSILLSDTPADEPVSMPDNSAESGLALGEDSTIEDYLAYAALNNPALEAAFYRWKAAGEQVPQVTALPDPRFTYRYFIEQMETQQQAFEISQTIPWFNKLALKGDAAGEAANAAWQQYEAMKLRLFYQVKDAYYEFYYLGRALRTVEENIELVKNFEGVVRMRYQTATAQHPDVIRAQVELGKLEDRLTSLRELQGPIAARLNAALNRPADAPIARPVEIEEARIAVNDGRILEMMAQANPELMALQYDIARNRTAIDLAQKEYFPDLTFGLEFIDTSDSIAAIPPRDSGQDPVIAMVSLNLPVWGGKLDAGVREARYQYHAAVRNRTDKLNTLKAALKMALYEFRDAERKAELYRHTLLPKAVESVKANDASFRSGGSTFLEVIDAQRVMLEFELAHERALSNKAQRLAELEMLVGTQLPRSQDLTPQSGDIP